MTTGNWMKGMAAGASSPPWFFPPAYHLEMMTPVMTLMLHIVFGLVLGAIYALERPDTSRALQGART